MLALSFILADKSLPIQANGCCKLSKSSSCLNWLSLSSPFKYCSLIFSNVEIIGLSADSVKAQKSFCEKKNFPFALLSDESKDTIKAYGAWGLKKFMGREYEGIHRYSYLIDENGIIEKVYSKVKTKTHAKDVLEDLVK